MSNDYSYPRVVRTVDPLVIRVDKLTLLVGSTNFYAKIKNGSAYRGFYIYSSGLGSPIYKKVVPNTGTTELSDGTTVNVSKLKTNEQLANAAEIWINELQDSFSNVDEDTSVKAAIDRLCWQLHYDITKTSANMPSDMADVDIDKTADTMSDYNTELSTGIVKIATNIKSDNDAYTISQALREGSSSKSIAEQISEQQLALTNSLSSISQTLSNIESNTDSIITDTNSISSITSSLGTSVNNIKTNTDSIITNTSTLASSNGYLSNISLKSNSIDTSLNNIETYTNDIKTKVDNTYITISSGGNDVHAFRTYGSTNGW